MNLIWATRGRSWGFRFLLNAGYPDPLSPYERAFLDMEGEVAGYRRAGEQVALRFPDPLNRKDTAGRVIPHNFVVLPPLAQAINSVDDGLEKVWPLVQGIYEQLWEAKEPPSAEAIQSAINGESPLTETGDLADAPDSVDHPA